MDPVTKIGTCCYCGTRALLSLEGTTRHELACASCGAPLHNLKQLKQPSVEARPARAMGRPKAKATVKRTKTKKVEKPRKKRGWGYWIREAIDEIEDIFD